MSLWRPAGISRIVLVYKLPLQSLTFGLGLGLRFKTKFFGIGLEAQVLVLGLAARGLGSTLPPKALSGMLQVV